ncbi:MAG: hypothetical protein M1375_01600 [Candidatus Thermoplasmatota archaeon]|jgi:hypothetical protein|nr:hypothetical protein [Candidatus Thermoplasmatota archaeon]MCL5790652.1 hypothetical protein [Candidatus Thermoplasmatota archaeon]
MVVKISPTHSNILKEIGKNNIFIGSEEPVYIGIILKPEPGVWEELMDADSFNIHFKDMVIEVRIGYRIEVGENSIFFVTSESGEIKELLSELKK